jgi:hypothetical protein
LVHLDSNFLPLCGMSMAKNRPTMSGGFFMVYEPELAPNVGCGVN